jgi:hypothetical protein
VVEESGGAASNGVLLSLGAQLRLVFGLERLELRELRDGEHDVAFEEARLMVPPCHHPSELLVGRRLLHADAHGALLDLLRAVHAGAAVALRVLDGETLADGTRREERRGRSRGRTASAARAAVLRDLRLEAPDVVRTQRVEVRQQRRVEEDILQARAVMPVSRHRRQQRGWHLALFLGRRGTRLDRELGFVLLFCAAPRDIRS